MGAAAVITPCVDTPEQARAVVDGAKVPAAGEALLRNRPSHRSRGRNYSDTANDDTMLIAQIDRPRRSRT
jgi:2-keto-3-deoxy-L-rhamnonate aldolase RhmA